MPKNFGGSPRLERILVHIYAFTLLFLSVLWQFLSEIVYACRQTMVTFGCPSFSIGPLDALSELSATIDSANPNKQVCRSRRRYKLVLDLDETLVHTSFTKTAHYDLRVEVCGVRGASVFYVLKRPFVDEFLEFVGTVSRRSIVL